MAVNNGLSLVDVNTVSKLLPKKDSHVGKVRIRKAQTKPKIDNADAGPPSPVSPLLNSIDPELRSTFPSGLPFDDKVNIIQCKHCKKPMLAMVANEHITGCIQKKNEKAQRKKEQKEANRKAREAQQKAERAEEEAALDAEGDEDSANGDKSTMGKKSAVKSSAGTSKKRKADDEADKNPMKKKTKKELEAAKPKAPKPKGPVDVEKQCGVLLPNGAMCARSLTCKSHAMGAKRAVPGRSLPYDMLLAAYQKKNQAKQQKAAIDANAPLLDDINDNAGPVDSDEEKDLVMAGIARSRPAPIAQHVPFSMRRKYQFIRVKDMIRSALGTNKAGLGGPNAGGEAEEGDVRRQSFSQPASARGSIAAGIGAPQRKASVVTPATPVAAN